VAELPQPKPPADPKAEAWVIGAMLADASHIRAVPASITPEAFFVASHAAVYSAISELIAGRIDVDRTTVEALLRRQGRLPQLADGSSYLQRMAETTPVLTPGAFDTHCKSIADKALLRAAARVLHEALTRVYEPSANVTEILAELEKSVLKLSLSSHEEGGLRHIKEPLTEELTEWYERAHGRGSPGIPTNYRAYDEMTGGLHRGDLIVIAARPGMGKTSLITGMATNVAKRGECAAIFSLEMPARQLAARLMCTEAGVSLARTRGAALTSTELTKVTVSLKELSKLGLYVDDAAKGRPYITDIVARSRRLASNLQRDGKRLSLIVVDYIQIVRLREVLLKQRHELAIGEVSTELKCLAKELSCTIIGVAQLNRSVESRPDKRPNMADLRDSGQIEQDADVIAMLYRDEVYQPGKGNAGKAELIVEKNRSGPTGTAHLRFDGPTTQFVDDVEWQE